MYKTTRKPSGSTVMTCDDCGHSISANEIREKPLQSATNMLKHMAAHNASRAFATAERIIGVEPIPPVALVTPPELLQTTCLEKSDQVSDSTILVRTEVPRMEDASDTPTEQIPIM